jgi:hypothetical protein
MYYVLEQVPRISNDNKLVWDFIATRSMFPNTFKTAVKQKTRWIMGITMQSFKFRDIFAAKGLSFAGRYSLYKDLKAKVGNLLTIVGYPVLAYFFASMLAPLAPIYPTHSLSWYLSLVVTIMMFERQLFRSVAIYHVYGMRSVFFACLLPPLLPIRVVWGNIINLTATLKAYRQFFFGQPPAKKPKLDKKTRARLKITCPPACKYCAKGKPLKCSDNIACSVKKMRYPLPDYKCLRFKYDLSKCECPPPAGVLETRPVTAATAAPSASPPPVSADKTKKLAWDKTDHTFLAQNVLRRYHRNLGDVLLEKGIVPLDDLQKALQDMDKDNQKIGNCLIDKKLITEKQMLTALSHIKHTQFIDTPYFEYYGLKRYADSFDEALLRGLLALPLLKTETGYMVAFCDESPIDAQTRLREMYGITVSPVFAPRDSIESGLDDMYGTNHKRPMIFDLYEKGMVNAEQVVIGVNYLLSTGKPEAEMLNYMGLGSDARLEG